MAQGLRSDLPNVSVVHQVIASTRRLLRSAWTLTGMGITAGVGLTLLVGVSLMDLTVPLRPWFRFTALMLVSIPTAWLLVTGVVRPLFRRMTARFVARRIESTLPGIHNRLVSCVDLDSAKSPEHSSAFLRRLIAEAVERIQKFRLSAVLDGRALWRAAFFALIGTSAFATALGVFSDRLPTALARIFSPFADIPPATGVVFNALPGNCKVLRGEPVEFVATVTKGAVERLRLELTPIEGEHAGKTLWHDLKANDRSDGAACWTFRLPAYEHSFEYRIHGGGTWTKLATVTMLERPRLVGLQASVNYPAYMGLTEPRLNPHDVADVSGPIGSTVEVKVQVEGDASIGEIQRLKEEFKTVEVANRLPRTWFDNILPKGHAVEGKWEWEPKPEALDPQAKPAAPANAPEKKPNTTRRRSINGAVTVAPDNNTAQSAKWHTHPAAPGMSYHLFHSAAVPFEIHPGDVVFAEVFIETDEPTVELMLQFHDGQNWERRAFWGEDKIAAGTVDTVSRRRVGDLPTTGEWVRLEVPAQWLDLEGRTIRGVSFTQFSGKCLWGRVGTLPPASRQIRELVVAESFPLKRINAANEHGEGDSKSQGSYSQLKSHFAAIRQAETWSGTFPIERDGWYRVELKNEIGYANQAMYEARIVSVSDNPPQVMIERPGVDLVLSEPLKVPLVIAAFDDFGLGELLLSTQRGENSAFSGRTAKTYSEVQRADTAIVTLDLIDMALKSGDVLKYRAEVRDRNPRGQSAQTQDFTIRILANDANAADKKLAQFEQQEDTFREKLAQLIAEQKQVQQKLDKLEEKYQPLTDKVEAAQAEADKAAADAAKEHAAKVEAAKNDPNNKELAKAAQTPPAPPEMKLDAEAQTLLSELKQELAALQTQEQTNANTAQQLNDQLKAMANDAASQQLLPPQLQREMQNLAEMFQKAATTPLKDLAAQMQKVTQPQAKNPKLPQLDARADQVQQNLEALKDRMDALREAQKMARTDATKALEQLQREMTRQAGQLTERELAELRKAIEALRQELQNLANDQSQLAEVTPEAPNLLLNDLEKKQSELDQKTDKELAKTKELQKSDEYKKLKQKRNPKFPNRPYDPETGEMLTPPDEADTSPTDEELKAKSDGEKPNYEPKKPSDMDDPDEDLFMPALGGRKPKTDPRFKDKQRPVPKKPSKEGDPQANDPEQKRQELADRQADQLDKLNRADASLAADQSTLEKLLSQLQQALQQARAQGKPQSGKPQSGKPSDQSNPSDPGDPSDPSDAAYTPELFAEAAAELAELLQSEAAQKAMQMAARLQAMASGQKPPSPSQPGQQKTGPQPPPPNSPPRPVGALEAGEGTQFAMEAALKDLDPNTRAVILKMQPRVREELLQGLREEGPDGYQRFIRDYFERLTKAGQTTGK